MYPCVRRAFLYEWLCSSSHWIGCASQIAKAEALGVEVVDELGWFKLVESKTDKARAFPSKKVGSFVSANGNHIIQIMDDIR